MPDVTPFRGGVQYAWDSTSLGWLKECPRKYQYHMLEGWRSKSPSVHLDWGILYHSALEEHEKIMALGMDFESALRETVRTLLVRTWRDGAPWRSCSDLPSDDKASLKNRENLVRTVVWYIDKFRDDPAKTVLASGKPMVELNFQFEVDRGYVLCGYLDRVVEFQEQKFVMDRKSTTTTVGSYYFDQYDPDNQMSLYTVAAQVAFHTPVKGVIVDAAQVAVGFSRFVRSFVFKTQDQIEEWLTDAYEWFAQAERFTDSGRWPMNDKSCHKYSGCTFRKVCSKSPAVREKFLESDFTREPWNPLEPR